MRVLPLLLLAALLYGCGSSSYSKRDFVARANAICASAVRQTRAVAPPTSTGGGLSALHGYLAQTLPIVRSEASQIRALKRPPGTAGDRALLARYLDALGRQVAGYAALSAAAKRGDAQGVADAEAALRATAAASLAASYGMRSCATPGGTAA